MTYDRELLESAAKAAGIDYYARAQSGGMLTDNGEWNPLTDDGDTLRLAVKKRLRIVFTDKTVQVWESEDAPRALAVEWLHPDPYAATRRAIVRAAAEIGRSKT